MVERTFWHCCGRKQFAQSHCTEAFTEDQAFASCQYPLAGILDGRSVFIAHVKIYWTGRLISIARIQKSTRIYKK